MSVEIGLVSCVKTKRDEPTTPRNLYTSDYFRKMRSYAEQYHDEWWILSAKHGLLDPDGEPIEPYEETLRNATRATKREWAEHVAEQLEAAGAEQNQQQDSTGFLAGVLQRLRNLF